MVDYRTALAAVLGVGLGALLLVAPAAVIRVHLVGRVPWDRPAEYGAEAALPERWRWLARLVGLVLLAFGAYLGAATLGLVAGG